jgi:hypothetical protein
MLLKTIVPILTHTVPKTVSPAPGEDAAELVQDAVVAAVQMLECDEKAGRKPIPASIAYYVIQRMKCGRRSYSANATDVLSPAAQLTKGFSVISMQAPVACGADEDDESLCFGDILASRRDDPATEACRRCDWDRFLGTQDSRSRTILHDLAVGNGLSRTAAKLKVSPPRVTQLKDRIGRDIRHHMGDAILAEIADEPLWRRARSGKTPYDHGAGRGGREPSKAGLRAGVASGPDQTAATERRRAKGSESVGG